MFLISGLMVLLLLSNNRYIFNSFYINGHLFFAVCFTLMAASGWLAANKEPKMAGLMAVAIPALIVTRPEGVLFAVLAMTPFLLNSSVSWRRRAFVLAIFGVSAALWSSYVALAYTELGRDLPFSTLGPLGLGIFALTAVPVLLWKGLGTHRQLILFASEAFLWLALGGLALMRPEILVVSIEATWKNVVMGAGSWGSSLVILTVVFLFVLLFCRDRGLDYLRYPVTASVPLFFLLAYFRDGAYRVGNGDSLNRMLIQIVPLAVLFLAAAATSKQWRVPEWIARKIAVFKAPEAQQST